VQWYLFSVLVSPPNAEDGGAEHHRNVFVACTDPAAKTAFLKLHGLPPVGDNQRIGFSNLNASNSFDAANVFRGIYDGEHPFYLGSNACWISSYIDIDNVKPGYYTVSREVDLGGGGGGTMFLLVTGDDSVKGTHTTWLRQSGTTLDLGLMKVLLLSKVSLVVRAESMDWKTAGMRCNNAKFVRVPAATAQTLKEGEIARRNKLVTDHEHYLNYDSSDSDDDNVRNDDEGGEGDDDNRENGSGNEGIRDSDEDDNDEEGDGDNDEAGDEGDNDEAGDEDEDDEGDDNRKEDIGVNDE